MRYIYQNVVQDGRGNYVADASVTVTLAGGATKASIYSALTGGTVDADGIITTGADGTFSFYVDEDDYSHSQQFRIVWSKSGFASETWDYIQIFPDGDRTLLTDSTVDQGDSSIVGTLAWHIDAVAGSETTIKTLAGTLDLTTNDTIPSTVDIEFVRGAVIDGSGTLTFDNPAQIKAQPDQQIFGSSITVTFTNAGTVHPELWGIDGTDDQTEINLAMNSLLSGGDVELFGKTYNVEAVSGEVYAVQMVSDIWLHGVQGVTTLKQPTGGDAANPVHLDGVSNVKITDLIIDGNKDNVASGHGVRGIGVLDEITIKRVEVKEANGYGIGFQEGTFTNILFRDLYLHDIENDAIDFKNRNDINSNIVLDNIRIADFGENAALSDQAGIDVRGPVKMTNIDISGYGTIQGLTGIRLAAGELLGANGLGALYSQVTNFKIVCDNKTNSTYGIVDNTRFCQISNGYIEGARRGLAISDLKNDVTNVVAKDCQYGLEILDEGGAGDFNLVTNFMSLNAGDDGIVINAVGDNTLVNCSAIDSTGDGIKVVGGSTNTTIIGGVVSGSGGNEVDDSGTNTIIKGLSGWKLKNRGTGKILNGNTSVTITHGMGRDIDIEHVTITPAESTATSKSNWVTGLGATDFVVNVEADPGEDWDFGWQVDMEY